VSLHCAECGRELVCLGDEPPPTTCEDCIPETGPGSPLVEQFAANLRQLRNAAGMTGEELGRRAAMSRQEPLQHEGSAAREPTVTRALRLAHSLEGSIDQLASRIYWNPGEVARKPSERRPPSQRLSGFFLVPPEGESVFDPAPPREPVVNRHEAAVIFGQNVRSARERRHLIQTKLARAVGLGKDGLSLIERGIRETTIEKLLALARALEVTPEFLLGGVAWRPKLVSCAPLGPGGARRPPARSLDAPIRDLWRQERTAREIADAVGTSHGGVSAIVHRLREHGEELPYRNPPTRAVHEGARRRRSSLPPPRRQEAEEAVEQTADADRREAASKDDVAARIGANVAFHRRQAGLSQEQLSEAIETERSYVSQIERGTFVPRIGLVVKLAASLNIRCERVTSGIIWEPSMGAFYMEATEDESGTPSKRLGHNALRARQRIGVSQQALSARASMSRGDVVDFEHGSRNFFLSFIRSTSCSIGGRMVTTVLRRSGTVKRAGSLPERSSSSR